MLSGLCESIGLSFSLSWVSLSQSRQLGDGFAGGVDGGTFSSLEPAAVVVRVWDR